MAKPKNSLTKSHPKNEMVTHQITQVGHIGPIPHPQILAEYERLSPGAANRIIAMAEAESSHRHNIENKAIDADIEFVNRDYSEARLGQIFGFLIAILALIGSFYSAVNGAQLAGSIIGTGGISAVVAVFIYGRKKLEIQKAAQEAKNRSKEERERDGKTQTGGVV